MLLLNMPPRHKDHFEPKALGKPGTRRAFCILASSLLPKRTRSNSQVKDVLPVPAETFSSPKQGVGAERILCQQTLLKYLFPSSYLPVWSSCVSTLPLFVQPTVKALRSCPFFGSSFPYEGSRSH